MPNIYSFLQTAYHFVKSLVVSVTKKMYRTAAVLFTGLTVVTVVSFNSSSFRSYSASSHAQMKAPWYSSSIVFFTSGVW